MWIPCKTENHHGHCFSIKIPRNDFTDSLLADFCHGYFLRIYFWNAHHPKRESQKLRGYFRNRNQRRTQPGTYYRWPFEDAGTIVWSALPYFSRLYRKRFSRRTSIGKSAEISAAKN